jgi:Uri superfamily endonuclease
MVKSKQLLALSIKHLIQCIYSSHQMPRCLVRLSVHFDPRQSNHYLFLNEWHQQHFKSTIISATISHHGRPACAALCRYIREMRRGDGDYGCYTKNCSSHLFVLGPETNRLMQQSPSQAPQPRSSLVSRRIQTAATHVDMLLKDADRSCVQRVARKKRAREVAAIAALAVAADRTVESCETWPRLMTP